MRAIKVTKVEGNDAFLQALEPSFVAKDLVDERFVRKAIDAVGGPSVFGIPASYSRQEVFAL
ncbi:hypothetical protein [Xenophilus sp. Marseille-Q4582]|uniref:hypothetical protein n=1 Tax=Xenophilus sp. Marseille-Q4582 TaxID=2866600 RepID=UPI00351CB8C1